MDNSVLTIATTRQILQASMLVKRFFCKMKKKKVEVSFPKIVQEYNKFMGGTDCQDQNLNKYRISLRGKK